MPAAPGSQKSRRRTYSAASSRWTREPPLGARELAGGRACLPWEPCGRPARTCSSSCPAPAQPRKGRGSRETRPTPRLRDRVCAPLTAGCRLAAVAAAEGRASPRPRPRPGLLRSPGQLGPACPSPHHPACRALLTFSCARLSRFWTFLAKMPVLDVGHAAGARRLRGAERRRGGVETREEEEQEERERRAKSRRAPGG